jgi:hypothetical protein
MNQPNTSVQHQGPHAEPAAADQMSTAETLTSIFMEPGRVFESFRERPRFIVAALITLAAVIAYQMLFMQRIGYENIVRARIEASPRAADMDPAQKEQVIQMQSRPVFKLLGPVIAVVGFFVVLAVGAGLYLLGSMMLAKAMGYWQALSVWAYASYPPTIIMMLLSIVVLFIKSPEDIDVMKAQGGLVRANLGFLVDGTANPVLATAVGALDLFAFYGLFLAALGLRKAGRLSSESAWMIVLVVWVIGLVLRLAAAAILKFPMA